MTAFQIAGITVCGCMALVSLRRAFAKSGARLQPLGWTGIWAAATAAFINPDATTVMARRLGIERGADMVLYSAVVAGAVAFWLVSLRLRTQSRQITLLTREIAVITAKSPDIVAEQDAPSRVESTT